MDCTKEYLDEKRIGMTIKNIIAESITLNHPTEPEMNFLYGVIFVGTPKNPKKNHSRNICIFANGKLIEALLALESVPKLQSTTRAEKLVWENQYL